MVCLSQLYSRRRPDLSQDRRHEASRSRSVSPREEAEDTRLPHDLFGKMADAQESRYSEAIARLCATRSQRQC